MELSADELAALRNLRDGVTDWRKPFGLLQAGVVTIRFKDAGLIKKKVIGGWELTSAGKVAIEAAEGKKRN